MKRTVVSLNQARQAIDAGLPGAAVAVLRKSLAARNPYLARVNPKLREAAEIFVRLTADNPAEATTIGWAVFLHRAALHLPSDTCDGASDTARLLLGLAQSRARRTPSAAVTIPTRLMDGGHRAAQAMAARFSVVVLLHAHGLDDAAESEAMAALHQWAPHHDEAPDVTYTYLADAVVLLSESGRTRQGEALLKAYGALLPEMAADGYELSVLRPIDAQAGSDELTMYRYSQRGSPVVSSGRRPSRTSEENLSS